MTSRLKFVLQSMTPAKLVERRLMTALRLNVVVMKQRITIQMTKEIADSALRMSQIISSILIQLRRTSSVLMRTVRSVLSLDISMITKKIQLSA